MLTEDQIKQNIESMIGQGAADADIQEYLNNLDSQYKSSQTRPEDNKGFFSSLLQGVALPVTKMGASGSMILGSALKNSARLVGKDQFADRLEQEMLRTSQEGVDFGMLGTVKPFGHSFANEKMGVGEALGRTVLEVGGTAAEVASYAFAPLKIASKAGFFKNIFNPASLKATAPFAVPFSLGKASQAVGEGGSAKDALVEGAGAYVGTVMGFNLINGGAALLSNFGGRLARNDMVKASLNKIYDLADTFVNSTDKGVRTRLGQEIKTSSRLVKDEFQTAHKNLVDGVIDSLTPPAPTGQEAFQGYKKSLKNFITTMYKKKTNDFADVYNDSFKTETFDHLIEGIRFANQEIDAIEKTGIYGYNAFTVNSPVKQYIQIIKNVLGDKFNKPASLKAIDALYSASDNFLGGSNAENSIVRKLAHDLLDDTTNQVSKNKPSLLSRWIQARNFSQEVSKNVNSEFAGKLLQAPKLDNFVDDIVSGKAPNREEIRSFMQAFTPDEKNDISQSVFNSLMQKVKNMQPDDAAELVDNALRELNQFGKDNLLVPGHLDQLQSLSDVLRTKFDDFVFNAKNLSQTTDDAASLGAKKVEQGLTKDIVDLAEQGRYSEMGEKISKITGTEELNAVLGLVENPQARQDIGNEILRGIINKNKSSINVDGNKMNLEQLFNDINKIGGANKDDIFKKLFSEEQIGYINYLSKLKAQAGSLDNLKGVKFLKAAHAVTGLLYGVTGRPVPAVYHLSQLAKVKAAVDMPDGEILGIMKELTDDGRIAESNFMKIGEGIKEAINNRIAAPTLETFYNAARSMFGRDLTPKEQRELEEMYNE